MRIVLAIAVVGLVGHAVVVQTTKNPYTVAYASFGPLNSAIYVADADGSHERILIGGSVLDMNPSFAPDGQSVVFTSRRNGSADIYRVRLDGSGLRRLSAEHGLGEQC